MNLKTKFTEQAGIEYPIICGAMYPCSNPELVAAASAAGGLGIVQPLSLTFVHKHDFREGLKLIRSITDKPIGLNVLVEKSSAQYQDMNKKWVDIALEEGVKFFITALGNPTWVRDRIKPHGGILYHDVVNKKWAQMAIDYGVDGLIAVNNRAGGHAGDQTPEQLIADLKSFGKPVVCAGGIGDRAGFEKALSLGFDGIQMGTRFIATEECTAHADYKAAILNATGDDIILTKKLSGVNVAVINTSYMKRIGANPGKLAQYFLDHPKLKHYMRLFYLLKSTLDLKKAAMQGESFKDFWQAGKSVDGIEKIESVKNIVQRFVS
ncbi:MAG: nitronate monooxygenase [Xanthomonadaceae bacterium]|nr:nitronate monooxygenase [Xanthomonadaceae bacterium]